MKKHKILFGLLLAMALVLSCAGCASEPSGTPGSVPSDNGEALRIAYSCVANSDAAPWAGVLWDAIEAQCAENGWEFDGLSAGGVPAHQGEQVDELLARDPDYMILFAGDTNMASSWIKKCYEAQVPVIMASIDAAPSMQSYVSAFVGPDQEAMASQIASNMIRANGADAGLEVAVISGFEAQEDYILRARGFEKTLSYFSNYTLLATQYAGASREDAKHIMELYLKDYGERIDVVMCYDDEFALGAAEALKEAGRLDEVQIYSVGGTNEAIDAVADGVLAETVINSAEQIAQRCAEVISGLEEGIIPVHYVYTDCTYINADNAGDYAGKGEY